MTRPARAATVAASVFVVLAVATLLVPSHALARCFGVPEGEIGPAWIVHLNITSADGERDGAEFGAARGATEFFDEGTDLLEEDVADRRLLLYFVLGAVFIVTVAANRSVNSDSGRTSWTLTIEYRGSETKRFVLEWSAADLANVPATWSLRINPLRTGFIDMRAQSDVELTTGPGQNSFSILGDRVAQTITGLPPEALVLAAVAYGALVGAILYLRRRRRRRTEPPATAEGKPPQKPP